MKHSVDSLSCKHPPERLYCWYAYDCYAPNGDLCVACLDCHKVLKGTIEKERPHDQETV
jgi:hypothetical protein